MKFIVTLCLVMLSFFDFDQAKAHSKSQQTNSTYGELNLTSRDLIRMNPLGDHTHSDLYDFIVEDLMEDDDFFSHINQSRAKVLSFVEAQKEVLKDPQNLKPFIASISESQMSHILGSLCLADKRCVSVSIFDEMGLLHSVGQTERALMNRGIQEIYIEEDIFNSYAQGYETNPVYHRIMSPKSVSKEDGFWEITYPIFFDTQRQFASLSGPENAQSKRIGFIRFLRQGMQKMQR